MALAAVHSKAMVLFIVYCCSHCFGLFLSKALVLLGSACVISSFAIILLENRELVALLSLSSWCHVTVIVLCLFLAGPQAGL